MVYNFGNGKLEPSKIGFYIEHNREENININLVFSNNYKITFVNNHEIFCFETKKFVDINKKTVKDYIGKYFLIFKSNKKFKVKLSDYNICPTNDTSHSLVSRKHLVVIANSFLTMTPQVSGTHDYFELTKKLTINKIKYESDIKIWSLYL